MPDRRLLHCLAAALVIALVLVLPPAIIGRQAVNPGGQAGQGAQPPQPAALSIEAKVDAIFARWGTATPGCAVAVSADDKIVLQRAYGMADLEHDVINTPETIFEAGSVSKQFTAAAVLLLAREGRLGLDDPVRKYVPELPDYRVPLTIRMMLQHTSGLRDWGSVAGIGGWPRTTRVYTHAHVLDIASRQRALNFEPGTEWSYCNTGYNLAAVIVGRVSGQPFTEFVNRRIFAPLGMMRSSWRDDFTRVVKGRAIAYADRGGRFSTDMPFENVHGNGGLLTTVGDLLTWNAQFASPKIGDRDFVRLQEEPGRFNNGRRHDYGMGLYVVKYKGLREIYHSGTTAGYQALLTRFPDERLSVAVLCNVTSGAAARCAREVADLYLGDRAKAPMPVRGVAVSADHLASLAGLFRHTKTGQPLTILGDKIVLRVQDAVFVPQSEFQFVSTDRALTLEFDGGRIARLTSGNGATETFERVAPARPTPAELADYVGAYASDEAEVAMTAVVEGGELRLKRRPDVTTTLRPVYADAFAAPLGTIMFRRDAGGQVIEFSVVQDRVWDLRFKRSAPPQRPESKGTRNQTARPPAVNAAPTMRASR